MADLDVVLLAVENKRLLEELFGNIFVLDIEEDIVKLTVLVVYDLEVVVGVDFGQAWLDLDFRDVFVDFSDE